MSVLVWMLKILKAFFVKLAIVELMFLGVAYVVLAHRAEGPYALTDFAVDMIILLDRVGMPGLPELPDMAGLGTRSGLGPAPAEFGTALATLADALPPAPETWRKRDWRVSDAAAFAAAGAGLTGPARAHAGEILGRFEDVRRGRTPGAVASYARGDDLVVVVIHEAATGGGAGLPAGGTATGAAPVVVHGVAFAPFEDGPASGGMSAASARIAGQFSVDAVGMADMAALVSVLSGLDVAGLNARADTPDPQVSVARGVTVAPGLPRPAVTRAPDRGFELTGAPPDTPGGEKSSTGVCVRRAGVRICE